MSGVEGKRKGSGGNGVDGDNDSDLSERNYCDISDSEAGGIDG